MRYLVNAKVWVIALALAALSGCGGGSKGADGTSGATGQSALVNFQALAVGSSTCADGGVNVQSGLDTNSNGILEANEVQSNQPICNRANGVGTNGAVPTVRVNTSSFDGNSNGCTYGGTDIAITVDNEALSHSYLCNGAPGTLGSQGARGAKGDTGQPGSANTTAGTNGLSAIVSSFRGNGRAGNDNSRCAVTGGISVRVGTPGPIPVGSTISYVCNGSEISLSGGPSFPQCPTGGAIIRSSTSSTPQIVCNGTLVPWVDVTGTSQQAVSNTRYLANNSSLTTVTLPAASAVNVGDVVQVTGVGTGGWKIAQNDGQKIYTGSLGVNKQRRPVNAPDANHYALALAQEGSVIYTAAGDKLFKSTDAGQTWLALSNAPDVAGSGGSFRTIAASSDGRRVVAAGRNTSIYVSDDYGVHWTQTSTPNSYDWSAIASSTNGQYWFAFDGSGLPPYYSSDFGVTWTQGRPMNIGGARSLASSADGQTLFAASNVGVYVSNNYGATWTGLTIPPTVSVPISVSTSADGRRLLLADGYGRFYVSDDAGTTWTKPSLTDEQWRASAMSADGKTMVVSGDRTGVYTSVDYGVTWSKSDASDQVVYVALAVTANGLNWYGATDSNTNGLVGYALYPFTTLGTGGSLSGDQYDTVELQYTGDGVFNILNASSGAGLRAR